MCRLKYRRRTIQSKHSCCQQWFGAPQHLPRRIPPRNLDIVVRRARTPAPHATTGARQERATPQNLAEARGLCVSRTTLEQFRALHPRPEPGLPSGLSRWSKDGLRTLSRGSTKLTTKFGEGVRNFFAQKASCRSHTHFRELITVHHRDVSRTYGLERVAYLNVTSHERFGLTE